MSLNPLNPPVSAVWIPPLPVCEAAGGAAGAGGKLLLLNVSFHHLGIRRAYTFVQNRRGSAFCVLILCLNEICSLETSLWVTFSPTVEPRWLLLPVACPPLLWGENEFNDLRRPRWAGGPPGRSCGPGLPARPGPPLHLQLAALRLLAFRMERWQNKQPSRHVSPPRPRRPARALT